MDGLKGVQTLYAGFLRGPRFALETLKNVSLHLDQDPASQDRRLGATDFLAETTFPPRLRPPSVSGLLQGDPEQKWAHLIGYHSSSKTVA